MILCCEKGIWSFFSGRKANCPNPTYFSTFPTLICIAIIIKWQVLLCAWLRLFLNPSSLLLIYFSIPIPIHTVLITLAYNKYWYLIGQMPPLCSTLPELPFLFLDFCFLVFYTHTYIHTNTPTHPAWILSRFSLNLWINLEDTYHYYDRSFCLYAYRLFILFFVAFTKILQFSVYIWLDLFLVTLYFYFYCEWHISFCCSIWLVIVGLWNVSNLLILCHLFYQTF